MREAGEGATPYVHQVLSDLSIMPRGYKGVMERVSDQYCHGAIF